jgi:signal transduction histidine kinase
MSALHELAGTVAELFQVDCRFECTETILVQDNAAATHLYRIAQEALNNAIKHAKATCLRIHLRRTLREVELSVSDNGSGFPKGRTDNGGMGLQIMKYRAGIVGGDLRIQPGEGQGTTVSCSFRVDI